MIDDRRLEEFFQSLKNTDKDMMVRVSTQSQDGSKQIRRK